jgi:hypothetical protein
MNQAVRWAVPVLGAAALVALAPGAAAQEDLVGDRTVTVEPSMELTDGQTVTVTWSGFTPDSSVTVIQCADAGGLRSETCNTADAKFELPAGPEGTGSTELVVHTGPIGPEGRCDADENNACVIAANENLQDGVTATAPIRFAAGAPTAGETLPVTGSSSIPLALGGLGAIVLGALALVGAGRRTSSTA